MIDYLRSSLLLACSGGAASLDYDTVAELRGVRLLLVDQGIAEEAVPM